jgi:GT2 family glycosyltransferase
MDSQALVSVVIAVGRTEFFETALRSVIGQTYDAVEIVICDDATDGLAETVTDLYRASCRWPIRFLRNDLPEGADACFIRGVSEASGQYIKFMAGDAVLAPDCIGQMVAALGSHPQATLVAAHRQWVDAQGKALPENLATRFRVTEPTVFNGPDVVALLGEFTCNFIGELSSVLCRRDDLLESGADLFALNGETVGPLGHLALYAKLLHNAELIMLPATLTATRIAPQGLTEQGIEIAGTDSDHLPVFHRLIREAGWSSTSLDNGWVGARPLSAAMRFADFNLLAQLSAPLPQRLNPQQVEAWFGHRVPTAWQQTQIDQHLAEVGVPALLVVIRDFGNSPEKTQLSLDSLAAPAALHAAMQVVVLTDATELPASVLGLRLDALCVGGSNTAALLNRVVENYAFDWLIVIDAGTRFTPFGLTASVLKLLESPNARAAFADEMHRRPRGGLSSAMRPDFNLDYLLSYPLLTAGHWLLRRQTVADLGGFDERFANAAELDLILRLFEQEGAAQIIHISEPLLVCALPEAVDNPHEIETLQRHLRVRGYPQAVIEHTLPRRYHVQYGHTDQPLVSIIVPTKDQLPFLQRCVETLLHTTGYLNYELLIVDNNSETPEALEWLARIDALGSAQVRVLRYPHPFNYSRINNVAAAQARGEYLVLLNNDTAIVHARWLDELLNHALRPEVGVVGAKLLFPNGRMQHAGVRLGMDGPAGHQHIGEPGHIQGYMQRVQVDQDLSAVTAACLMIRRSIYEEVGGLDEEAFVVSYNDVDLCMKVGALGYLNVWTPHSVLIHEGSVSQTHVDTATQQAKRKRFVGEQLAMYRKWLPTLANDSAFNTNLSFDLQSVELELNMPLVWRPMAWRHDPVVLAYPEGLWASPHERVIAPFETLQAAGRVDGMLSSQPLSIPQEGRLKPNIVVFQARLDADHLQTIARAQLLPNAFVVLDINDLQLGSRTSGDDPFALDAESVDLLQKSLHQAHRVIASTQVLADIAAEFHADVRLLPSRLAPQVWGNLASRRGMGAKPRVGLVSDRWQPQDLHLMLAVVQTLADELEWVVMGDDQGVLRGHVQESHDRPSAEHYAQAVAGLNLDLALLPAVDNLFSACKNNISLLQLGACGVPVICSDVRAYADDLPVTRVPNTLETWVNLIRAHTMDLASAALLGDDLRERVLGEWMLDDAAVQAWREAWLPVAQA